MVDNGYGDVAFMLNHSEEYRRVADPQNMERSASYAIMPLEKRIISESALGGFNQLASDARKSGCSDEARKLETRAQNLADDLCL